MIEQYEIWIADLNPQIGTEAGKTRPVVIVQTNLLTKVSHPSTIVCPITTNISKESEILRVHLKKGSANLTQECDIMIDQVRVIDNRRLIKKAGKLSNHLIKLVRENLGIILDLE